jgi:hypothetical protein
MPVNGERVEQNPATLTKKVRKAGELDFEGKEDLKKLQGISTQDFTTSGNIPIGSKQFPEYIMYLDDGTEYNKITHKESGRCWFETFSEFMINKSFKQSIADPGLFYKEGIIVGLYVDDILPTGKNEIVQEFRIKLSDKGGIAKMYLGIAIDQTKDSISLNQTHYTKQKLKEYEKYVGNISQCASPLVENFQGLLIKAQNSDETEPDFPYRSMVGSLNYAMITHCLNQKSSKPQKN